MKKVIIASFLAIAMLALMVGPATAKKPDIVVQHSNGFPSGPHYNLNIIGKNAEFDFELECAPPAPEDPMNVIYVPENTTGQAIKILMESGKGGPKSAPGSLIFEVTDWCTGFEERDEAKIRLPADPLGYHVYARAVGKPPKEEGEVREIYFYEPELRSVQDEYGNDLWYLGLVTSNGFALPQDPMLTISRTKGKSKAIEITGLFMWSGTICFLAQCDGCEETHFCCQPPCECDTPPCDPKDCEYQECYQKPESEACAEGYDQVTTYCKTYGEEDPVWVFNIAEFVDYLWNMDNNGVKVLQVRFYPISEISE